jgi:hypothetical protein
MMRCLIRDTKDVNIVTLLLTTVAYAMSYTFGATTYQIFSPNFNPNNKIQPSFFRENFLVGGITGVVSYLIFAAATFLLTYLLDRKKKGYDYLCAITIVPLPVTIFLLETSTAQAEHPIIQTNNQTPLASTWIAAEAMLWTLIGAGLLAKKHIYKNYPAPAAEAPLISNHRHSTYDTDAYVIDIVPTHKPKTKKPKRVQKNIKKTTMLPQQSSYFRSKYNTLSNEDKIEWLEKSYKISIEFPTPLYALTHCAMFFTVMSDPVGIPGTNKTYQQQRDTYTDQQLCVERSKILQWLKTSNNVNPYTKQHLRPEQLTEKTYLKYQINDMIKDLTASLKDCNSQQAATSNVQKTFDSYLRQFGVCA